MMKRFVVVAAAMALFACTYAFAEGPKSGPQVGENIPGPFHVLNACNAEKPDTNGTKTCLVCQHGGKSVAMIFTREMNPSVAGLLKKLDGQVAKSNKKMGAFVVYLTSDEGAEKKLKDMAEKEGIKNVSLTVMEPAGPNDYKIAKDAAVTVVLYKQSKVEANHAFNKGEFNDKAVAAIVNDLPKIDTK